MSQTHSKTIVVTGGAGFVGSRLCERLIKEGHRVISLDNYFAGSKNNHVSGVDYREGHTKDIAMHVSETPDLIYHLGEYSRVEQSLLEPDIVYDLNTVGTAGVLEFWKAKRCKFVYAGSSTKFGDGGLTRNSSPYAFTKAANSERVKKYGTELKLPYAITYFYNVYGPGERAGIYGTVIEIFKQMYLTGTPLTVTTPGTQQRNFTHVDDIVEGLIAVGERGEGDEFGLGNERSYTILEVARLFGGDIVMLPPREGNRMESALDTSKANRIGWKAVRSLEDYIADFVRTHDRALAREKRVLVFSTTFYPVMGPAERALHDLMEKMPDVQFDIVTTAFTSNAAPSVPHLPNVHLYQVGYGRPFDKYLLPVLGFWQAQKLHRVHRYLFGWALMASYAALAGVLLKRSTGLPLLVTLADQDLEKVSGISRTALRHIVLTADQVYGLNPRQEQNAVHIAEKPLRKSIGKGDAFANQLRFVYAQMFARRPL